MAATILPFPLARRVGYVRKQADYVLSVSHKAGERHMERQLELQRQNLLTKGVNPAAVDAQVAALRSAFRRELWREVMMPGGAR